MESQNVPDRLDELLERLCEDQLDGVEFDELARLLTESPENRTRYLDYIELHSALWQGLSTGQPDLTASVPCTVAAEQVANGPNVTSCPTVRPIRSVLLVAAGACAMAVSILVIVGLFRLTSGQATTTPPSHIAGDIVPEATDDGIAVLTRAAGVQWTSEASFAVGDTVPPGEIAIGAGLLELEFYSGAALILEGPAELNLVSKELCLCRSGKVRVHVPRQARGFTVLSPNVKLVDLGTEFGMEVKPSVKTEVHVFEGKVELYPSGNQNAQDTGEEITAGEAVCIRQSGESHTLESQASRFVSPTELDRRVALEIEERQARLRQHWQEASKDERIVVAYAFEPQGSFSRKLQAMGAAAPALDGAIIGCRWTEGRWPGKSALEFKRPGDRVRVHVPGQFESLTLAAWIRVDGLDRVFQTLMLTDGYRPGEPHWQIKDDGRLILGVRHTVGKGHNYATPVVFDLSRLGQWVHVACVFDGVAEEVRHYVDGRAIRVEPIVAPVRLQIGDAEIGNWGVPVRESPTPIRSFNGRIDEFAVFSAALSNEEINLLYEQGRP